MVPTIIIIVSVLKKNPLKNYRVMMKLNPFAGVQKKAARLVQENRLKEKQKKLDEKRGIATVADSGKAHP